MKEVKNNSIGMGLACSRMIIKQLRGNLVLVESERGKTVFKLSLPVECQNYVLEEISQKEEVSQQHMVLFNYKRVLTY